jgi:hypothetical protein
VAMAATSSAPSATHHHHHDAPPGPSLLHYPLLSSSLPELTDMWRRRAISNYEYLMWLNHHAGRRWGDRSAHFIMPWVLDFTCPPAGGQRCVHQLPRGSPPAGWRDLSRSKYRWEEEALLMTAD